MPHLSFDCSLTKAQTHGVGRSHVLYLFISGQKEGQQAQVLKLAKRKKGKGCMEICANLTASGTEQPHPKQKSQHLREQIQFVTAHGMYVNNIIKPKQRAAEVNRGQGYIQVRKGDPSNVGSATSSHNVFSASLSITAALVP